MAMLVSGRGSAFFSENPLAMRLLHKNSHMPQPPLTSVLNTLEEYFDAQKLRPPFKHLFLHVWGWPFFFFRTYDQHLSRMILDPRRRSLWSHRSMKRIDNKGGNFWARILGVEPKIGVGPQNGWFIRENPIKMGWFGVPLFLETPILVLNHLHFVQLSGHPVVLASVIENTKTSLLEMGWNGGNDEMQGTNPHPPNGKNKKSRHLLKCAWLKGIPSLKLTANAHENPHLSW